MGVDVCTQGVMLDGGEMAYLARGPGCPMRRAHPGGRFRGMDEMRVFIIGPTWLAVVSVWRFAYKDTELVALKHLCAVA